jgi:hypothetical protein
MMKNDSEISTTDPLVVLVRIARPLLRGCLVGIYEDTWRDDPENPGYEFADARIQVHCPYCGYGHFHRFNAALDARFAVYIPVADCYRNTPFKKTGYFISTWPHKFAEYKGHVIRPGRQILRPKSASVISIPPTGDGRAA